MSHPVNAARAKIPARPPRMHAYFSTLNEAWREYAACAGHGDPEIFYAPENSYSELAAKRVCAHCPVRIECLTAAINNAESHGIWGGFNPAERRRVAAGAKQSTVRERQLAEVVRLSAEGHTGEQIADQLGIGVSTVYKFRAINRERDRI